MLLVKRKAIKNTKEITKKVSGVPPDSQQRLSRPFPKIDPPQTPGSGALPPSHTCHILPPAEIDLGLCSAVFAGSGGKYLFHRIGRKGRIWQPCLRAGPSRQAETPDSGGLLICEVRVSGGTTCLTLLVQRRFSSKVANNAAN